MHLMFEVSEEGQHYLESSARLRGMSRTALLRKTLDLVLSDQLFAAVVGEEEHQVKKRGNGGVGRAMPPKDKLYDALNRAHSVPTRVIGPQFRNADSRTRTEMESDLRQAVLNTGGRVDA